MDICEIHLTVSNKDSEEFIKICKENDIKYISIELVTNNGLETHLMTSIKVVNSLQDIGVITSRYLFLFSSIDIIRTKIETTPQNIIDHKLGYFYVELHLEVDKVFETVFPFTSLKNNWYISYNTKKEDYFSITCRKYNMQHESDIKPDLELLKDLKICSCDRPAYEFAIVDTNQKLDANWITNK